MKSTKPAKGRPATSQPKNNAGLKIKLQIAAGVFVPMFALGLWLNSKGFFG